MHLILLTCQILTISYNQHPFVRHIRYRHPTLTPSSADPCQTVDAAGTFRKPSRPALCRDGGHPGATRPPASPPGPSPRWRTRVPWVRAGWAKNCSLSGSRTSSNGRIPSGRTRSCNAAVSRPDWPR
uniref:(northern house mosquito) hypothetical protein n=1 Tax=Culex pipiens TaxID=7175 RepID=A0A8D8FPD8_CULPI